MWLYTNRPAPFCHTLDKHQLHGSIDWKSAYKVVWRSLWVFSQALRAFFMRSKETWNILWWPCVHGPYGKGRKRKGHWVIRQAGSCLVSWHGPPQMGLSRDIKVRRGKVPFKSNLNLMPDWTWFCLVLHIKGFCKSLSCDLTLKNKRARCLLIATPSGHRISEIYNTSGEWVRPSGRDQSCLV